MRIGLFNLAAIGFGVDIRFKLQGLVMGLFMTIVQKSFHFEGVIAHGQASGAYADLCYPLVYGPSLLVVGIGEDRIYTNRVGPLQMKEYVGSCCIQVFLFFYTK